MLQYVKYPIFNSNKKPRNTKRNRIMTNNQNKILSVETDKVGQIESNWKTFESTIKNMLKLKNPYPRI